MLVQGQDSFLVEQRRFEPLHLPSWGFLTTRHMQVLDLHISTLTWVAQNQNVSIATREHSTPRTRPDSSPEGTRYSRHLSTPSARLDVLVME
jgi:hypothetical protein